MKMVLNRMATKHLTVWPPLLPTSLYQPEKYCQCQCLKYNIKERCNNKTNSPTKAVFSSWSSSWESKLPRCALLSPDPRPRLCWRQISLSWLGGYEKHCSYAMGTQFCWKWGPKFEWDGGLLGTIASTNRDPKRKFLKIYRNEPIPGNSTCKYLNIQVQNSFPLTC